MKLSKKERHAAAEAAPLSPSYALQPGPSVPHQQKKVLEHISRLPDVLLYGGRTFTQPRLPALFGQYGLMEARDNQPPPPMLDEDLAAEEEVQAASEAPTLCISTIHRHRIPTNTAASEPRSGSDGRAKLSRSCCPTSRASSKNPSPSAKWMHAIPPEVFATAAPSFTKLRSSVFPVSPHLVLCFSC
jgi:hypothetical protein